MTGIATESVSFRTAAGQNLDTHETPGLLESSRKTIFTPSLGLEKLSKSVATGGDVGAADCVEAGF